jgi:hypothetical protein
MENKYFYRKLYPLLTDFELLPNSESYEYNCISYTIGIYDKSSWPTGDGNFWPVKKETTKESFDIFYEYYGFEKIACIQYDDCLWESKIGSLGIIRHDLFEIENERYGQVTQIYRKLRIINEILLFKDFINLKCI